MNAAALRDMASIRQQQSRFEGLTPGHRACQGCGQALAARLVLESSGPDVVVANATGCLEVFTTAWPQSAWTIPWMHSVFSNTAALASGMEAAFKARDIDTKVLAFAGDGGTFDIGFQALSGMIERGHNVLFVCYDNEAYMNTGIQRSSSTPVAAATTTSPAGIARTGKRHLKKDIVAIVAAHCMPYAATASVAYPNDLKDKVRRGIQTPGPAFLMIHSPCPLGWMHDSAKGIEVARLGVETGLVPLIEMEYGQQTSAMPLRGVRPVEDYLKPQGRFRHLFADDPMARQELAHLQALADHNITHYGLHESQPESGDSHAAASVRRGTVAVVPQGAA